MVVKVYYDQQEAKLKLLVVQGKTQDYWLSGLQLNWQEIHCLHSFSLLYRSIRQTC